MERSVTAASLADGVTQGDAVVRITPESDSSSVESPAVLAWKHLSVSSYS